MVTGVTKGERTTEGGWSEKEIVRNCFEGVRYRERQSYKQTEVIR